MTERPEHCAARLYVGANYHPHDSDPRQWERDIRMMKEAGFTVARLGHLAWDSFEPTDARFEFAWFDEVMDLMRDAGIGVILDIAVRPAPIWLHRKHPSIGITDPSGNALYPNTRYMVDAGDPEYRAHALRFADALTRRYAGHPALVAFGVDNEPGDGPYSYSETVRRRFVSWLRERHATIESLNRAWASQRWSRRIGDFDEVGLPVSGTVQGAPERVLDFRRFVSGEITEFLLSVIGRVEANAPGVFVTGNSWYYTEADRGRYFDYAEIAYSGRMSRDGMGFYPGLSLTDDTGLSEALMGIARIRFESDTPFWCTEFTTMTAVPGSVRRSAYASLLMGNQMVCGWTWQTMHGGEEQYLQGMVDWDGEPNRKYDEYRQIAAEFARIQHCGFPYRSRAEIALAFSFPSQLASASLPEKHDVQLQTCFDAVLERNLDQRVVDVSRSALPYRILVLPGVALLDEDTAERVRRFVADGGTVVMTSYSALVTEDGQVFTTIRPGLLADVFGVRLGAYQEPRLLHELTAGEPQGDELDIVYGDRRLRVEAPRIDEIHPGTARVTARSTGLDRDYPVVTVNDYGKGRAVYVGTPARRPLIDLVLDTETELREIRPDLPVPRGVLARALDATHLLYVNLDGESKPISTPGPTRSVLHERTHAESGFTLAPFDADVVEVLQHADGVGTPASTP
ncbi:beta-galactosidase [Streptomyces ziwulingensis]|uniref:beta-galactosidase n=1 Tax=Streptomyces ziwulingensis TaxID=1045501 RepID=A0ABP9CPE2_9ACTN